jgi:hypothetical protein
VVSTLLGQPDLDVQHRQAFAVAAASAFGPSST